MRQQFFWRKSKILLLLSVTFFDTGYLTKHSRIPLRNLSVLRDEKSLMENLDTPFPLLSINFFDTRNFLKNRSKRFVCEIFWPCETIKIDTKLWHNSLKHKSFRYPKLVTHWTVPQRILSELWDKNFSFLSVTFFDTGYLTKHSRIPLRNLSVLRDEKSLTENRDTPLSLLSKNFFATRKHLKHRSEGLLYETFRHCETKNFWSIKSFDTPN